MLYYKLIEFPHLGVLFVSFVRWATFLSFQREKKCLTQYILIYIYVGVVSFQMQTFNQLKRVSYLYILVQSNKNVTFNQSSS